MKIHIFDADRMHRLALGLLITRVLRAHKMRVFGPINEVAENFDLVDNLDSYIDDLLMEDPLVTIEID